MIKFETVRIISNGHGKIGLDQFKPFKPFKFSRSLFKFAVSFLDRFVKVVNSGRFILKSNNQLCNKPPYQKHEPWCNNQGLKLEKNQFIVNGL